VNPGLAGTDFVFIAVVASLILILVVWLVLSGSSTGEVREPPRLMIEAGVPR
jgi:hypothetical protein